MAIRTQGTLVEVQNAGTWLPVGEITNFDGPGGDSPEIDTTHLQSTAREYILGLKDEGDFTFDANLVPDDAGQVFVRQCRDANPPPAVPWRLTLTDAGTTQLTFLARVKGFRMSGGTDDKVGVAVSLRITGAVVWA